ncbi:hypothetical protein CDAR_184861 [Caerostris darwini]|uniref:Uncharacterized protein n=1 Tax=Caerostris darwini TaxID=1538125 RepID=A0AAV4SNG8_9ARAC|nr:hypothetical protein CDAR_184861 [Caerostris darwini]
MKRARFHTGHTDFLWCLSCDISFNSQLLFTGYNTFFHYCQDERGSGQLKIKTFLTKNPASIILMILPLKLRDCVYLLRRRLLHTSSVTEPRIVRTLRNLS